MEGHEAHDFLAAPGWSLILGNAGKAFIIFGVLFFLLCAVLPMMKREKVATTCFVLGSLSLFAAFASLVTLFVTDQFQFQYISSHSWRDLDLKYKIAAVWSGQQGSFLLWACTSALFGLLALRSTGPLKRWFTTTFSVFLACLCGILAYETPFNILADAPLNGVVRVPTNGAGLTASLQNYWVVIHPPTIFLGFGSLSVMFAFAVAAMMAGKPTDWAARVRPWSLISLAVLGLGLCMGGFWAYETQGWGGFWAWDPVENVSFVPWIFTAALVHGIIVQTTRKRWNGTNLLMAGLPFLLFVYGTFLTRSGFLSKFSNHSFAEMNRVALWILLGLLVAAIIAFMTLWITKGRRIGKEADVPPQSLGFNREAAYQTGVMLLCGLAATIAIGMSIPFFMGLMNHEGKVVEEPLYHNVVVWFFIPIMLLVAAGPFLSWKKNRSVDFWNRFFTILGATLFISGIAVLGFKFSDWGQHADTSQLIDFPLGIRVNRFYWVICLLLVCTLAAVSNIWRIIETFKKSKMGIGGFVAHIGLAMALAGLILSRGLERKVSMNVMQGSPAQGLGYLITYKSMTSTPDGDRDNKVLFDVTSMTDQRQTTFEARPGFFLVPGQDGKPGEFTWPHIEHTLTHDVYLSLGPPQFTLWEDPIMIKPGETHVEKFEGDPSEGPSLSITYEKFVMHGEPGQPGTRFGAKLKIVENGKTYYCEPTLSTSLEPDLVRATDNFYATFSQINAADKSIALQLPFTRILYPIELFYKPMTILVWLGTAILTLGGLLSALYRRRRPTIEEPASVVPPVHVEEDEHAPVATA